MARSLSEKVGPFAASASVFFLAGVVALGISLFISKDKRSFTAPPIFFLAAFFTTYVVFSYLAIYHAASRDQLLEVGIVNYLWPSLTIILSVYIFKIKVNNLLILAIFTLSLGMLITIGGSDLPLLFQSFYSNLKKNPLPYFAALLAALSWSIYSNLLKLWKEHIGAQTLPLILLSAAAFSYALKFSFPGQALWRQALWNNEAIAEATYLGLGASLAYYFWEYAMRKGNIVLVSSIS